MIRLEKYLKDLEDRCIAAAECAGDYILWPKSTTMACQGRIQDLIKFRFGDTDHDPTKGRVKLILDALRRIYLPDDKFSVFDVGCGDGLILSHIKDAFPNSACFGCDIAVGSKEGGHDELSRQKGIKFYCIFFQMLFQTYAPALFDVLLFMNMFNNMLMAKLRAHEQDLPEQVIEWLFRSGTLSIASIGGEASADALRSVGFNVEVLGNDNNSIGQANIAVLTADLYGKDPK